MPKGDRHRAKHGEDGRPRSEMHPDAGRWQAVSLLGQVAAQAQRALPDPLGLVRVILADDAGTAAAAVDAHGVLP